jgi:hypothetical protein
MAMPTPSWLPPKRFNAPSAKPATSSIFHKLFEEN